MTQKTGTKRRARILGSGFGLVLLLVAASPSAAQAAATKDLDWSSFPEVDPVVGTVPEPDEWLVDEEGNEYTIFKWRKHEGYYTWHDREKGEVKLNNILYLTVEHDDDEFFYFRWYNTAKLKDKIAKERLEKDRELEEQKAAAAAAYNTELAEQDVLALEPFDEGMPKSSQWRNGFDLADMNGDGHLDLIHGPPRKGAISEPVILLGDGAGRWTRWEIEVPLLPYDYGDMVVGDLNGDGHQDMVLGAHLTGVIALVGDGEGHFESWSEGLPLRRSAKKRQRRLEQELAERMPLAPAAARGSGRPPARSRPAAERDRAAGAAPPAAATREDQKSRRPKEPPAFTSRALALADWNQDGRLDILALSEGATSIQDITDEVATPLGKIVFLNQGDGSWVPLEGPGDINGDTIVPVDLDHDGRLDFVTDSRVVGLAELLNYHDGESWTLGSLPDLRNRAIVRSVAVADFDGNGRVDIALAFQSNDFGTTRQGIDLYLASEQTDGTWGWRRESVYSYVDRDFEGFRTLAAGDLDGDGDEDLVALHDRGETWLLLNDGRGAFTRELAPETAPDKEHLYCAGWDAEVVDLDGDGRSELVAAFAGEPGSERLMMGRIPIRCDARGAIHVWKVVPKS